MDFHKFQIVFFSVYLLFKIRQINQELTLGFNHTSYMAFVTPNDRPRSVPNRCVIEVFGCIFVLPIGILIVYWYGAFCHRIESDLFLFVLDRPKSVPNSCVIERICNVFVSLHLCTVCRLGLFVIRLRQISSFFSLEITDPLSSGQERYVIYM